MICQFSINCPILNKFQKRSRTKNTSAIVISVPSLEHILTLPLPMIKTLDLFPKLTSHRIDSSNCENNSFFPHMWLLPGIKISSIGASRHDIWKRNIGSTIFYQFIMNFHLFLGIYQHFIILSSIYRDNLGGQMRVNAVCAVKLLKMPQDFRCGGSNPSQKVWLAMNQPLGQLCSLIYNVHQIYIKSNSSYKHNFKKMF